jgi:hypothetical protein
MYGNLHHFGRPLSNLYECVVQTPQTLDICGKIMHVLMGKNEFFNNLGHLEEKLMRNLQLKYFLIIFFDLLKSFVDELFKQNLIFFIKFHFEIKNF